ncbi:hypothetical protein V5O48_006771 [Marasmius crinis-equi]|uniref:Uncharacterized protein n=1 Tax=Marasmius crinis-equi TaxID=585013 RepID=A0ABR3FIQ9_9AGAR
MPRGLGMLYQRTENTQFKSDIEQYLAVQYNAILDLSSANGSNVYAFDWIGPPSSIFDVNGQVTALGVLVPVIALPDTNSIPGSNPTFGSNPTPTFNSLPSKTPPVKGVVGGVVGGVLVLAIIVVLFLVRCRRHKKLFPQGQEADAQKQELRMEPITNSPHILAVRSGSRSPMRFREFGRTHRTQPLHIRPFTAQKQLPGRSGSEHEQPDDQQLLRQMGSALSLLNWQLARVEEDSTVGSESDVPPEYPGSALN